MSKSFVMPSDAPLLSLHLPLPIGVVVEVLNAARHALSGSQFDDIELRAHFDFGGKPRPQTTRLDVYGWLA